MKLKDTANFHKSFKKDYLINKKIDLYPLYWDGNYDAFNVETVHHLNSLGQIFTFRKNLSRFW